MESAANTAGKTFAVYIGEDLGGEEIRDRIADDIGRGTRTTC